MKLFISKLKWWIYELKHELPHPHKVAYYISPNYFDRQHLRSWKMARYYANGWDVQQIASVYNVTRERVRQCVEKELRIAKG